jgi:hypothetical protein
MWLHTAVTVSWPLSPVDRVQRVWWVFFVAPPWNFNSLSAWTVISGHDQLPKQCVFYYFHIVTFGIRCYKLARRYSFFRSLFLSISSFLLPLLIVCLCLLYFCLSFYPPLLVIFIKDTLDGWSHSPRQVSHNLNTVSDVTRAHIRVIHMRVTPKVMHTIFFKYTVLILQFC